MKENLQPEPTAEIIARFKKCVDYRIQSIEDYRKRAGKRIRQDIKDMTSELPQDSSSFPQSIILQKSEDNNMLTWYTVEYLPEGNNLVRTKQELEKDKVTVSRNRYEDWIEFGPKIIDNYAKLAKK
jgi:hypothetical protein